MSSDGEILSAGSNREARRRQQQTGGAIGAQSTDRLTGGMDAVDMLNGGLQGAVNASNADLRAFNVVFEANEDGRIRARFFEAIVVPGYQDRINVGSLSMVDGTIANAGISYLSGPVIWSGIPNPIAPLISDADGLQLQR